MLANKQTKKTGMLTLMEITPYLKRDRRIIIMRIGLYTVMKTSMLYI